MTNIERAAKLLADIGATNEESGVGLILAYAMEIRRECAGRVSGAASVSNTRRESWSSKYLGLDRTSK